MPKKSTTVLTAKKIENLKPPKVGVKEIWDAALPGFGLRLFSATGTRSWCLMTRMNGKQRRFTLGRFPDMGLKDARNTATTYLEMIADGEDPLEGESTDTTSTTEPDGLTFGELAESYIKIECLERRLENGKVLSPKLKRGWEVERIIRRELMPTWRDRPIAELRRRDAIKLTEALVDAGKPAAAHRLFEIIRRVGRWAARRDEIDFNPFAEMDPPATKVIRDRYLKPDEIVAVWRAWDAMGYPFGPLGKMLLVTAQRLSEVAQMQWSEIDRDTATWTIPAERTKSKRESEVPLSSLALEILDALPQFSAGDRAFTTTNGRRPVSGFSKMKSRSDELSEVNDWRLHDLRRTARTGLAELGVPQIVAEKVLNHAERNQLVKTYDRHEYADEKRDALERWARHVRDIIEPPPENVVRMRRG